MKTEKYQQVRLRISEYGMVVKHTANLDKNFKYLKGIYVGSPQTKAIVGSTLGVKVGQYELLEATHETRMLTCGDDVPPNQRYFIFPEAIEANGQSVELLFKDGALYPFLSDFNANPDGVIDVNASLSNSLIALPSYMKNPAGVVFPYDVRIYLLLTNKAI